MSFSDLKRFWPPPHFYYYDYCILTDIIPEQTATNNTTKMTIKQMNELTIKIRISVDARRVSRSLLLLITHSGETCYCNHRLKYESVNFVGHCASYDRGNACPTKY